MTVSIATVKLSPFLSNCVCVNQIDKNLVSHWHQITSCMNQILSNYIPSNYDLILPFTGTIRGKYLFSTYRIHGRPKNGASLLHRF